MAQNSFHQFQGTTLDIWILYSVVYKERRRNTTEINPVIRDTSTMTFGCRHSNQIKENQTGIQKPSSIWDMSDYFTSKTPAGPLKVLIHSSALLEDILSR